MNQNLHVNKTNIHMKGFALRLALKATRKLSTRKQHATPSTHDAPLSGKRCVHAFGSEMNVDMHE